MGTTRFVLRNDKPLKNGTSPIDLIYQVSGQRKYYRTDKKLYTHSWDLKKQVAIYLDKKTAKKLLPDVDFDLLPTAKEISNINSDLLQLKMDASNIERNFQLNRITYSSQMVIDKLKEKYNSTTKKEARSNEVFDFMDRYINDHSTTREAGSLAVYKSVKNHLQNYCKTTGKKVTFENIDYNFFQSFQNYLLQDKTDSNGKFIQGLNNTTVAKQLSTIKTFLNYARTQGIEVSTKYKDFKIKKDSLEVIALTNSEFETLFNLDLSNNKRLAQTRDVFCFACATGLRYSDLNMLKREHIKNDEIRLTVKKTKELLTIPLNSYSQSILARYSEMHKPLPVISNQNLNYAIKELCKLAGIDEPIEIVRFRGIKREANVYPKYELIGVHTGRKTFATLSLEKGMSAEEVMAITGHKDYESFKRYVKVTEQRKKVVMVKAWGEVKQNKLKAI
jgi:integrase